MKIKVHLLAFNEETPPPVRLVDIPDTFPGDRDDMLDAVFYYGQNDFQPQPQRSVCVGDVIELPDGALHRVRGVGFEALPEGANINSLERGFAACLL